VSYRLIIRPEAEWDIQDAFKWYDAQTPGLGAEFIRAVDVCLSGVGRNPFAYSLVYQQARRALVRRFPYAILFVCDQELVSVIACLHSKRSPRSWQDRL
jgi:plasmid stabilization system protein ParE